MKTQNFLIGDIEFTPTETRILILNCYCTKCEQIADYLGCSVNTVYAHLRAIRTKTKLFDCREIERFSLAYELRNKGMVGDVDLFETYGDLLPWNQNGPGS
ncbi:MAG: hypothetical protein K9J17_03240 [Flavobacteriales bacterium]|nr:hypothetical protein [Flavobacteriales bacterium]